MTILENHLKPLKLILKCQKNKGSIFLHIPSNIDFPWEILMTFKMVN